MTNSITMHGPDGNLWQVPSEVVAADRASFMARQATGAGPTPGNMGYEGSYRSAFEFALTRERLLVDWAERTMDWAALAPHARRVESDATQALAPD